MSAELYVISTKRKGKGLFISSDKSYSFVTEVGKQQGRSTFTNGVQSHLTAEECWEELCSMYNCNIVLTTKKVLDKMIAESESN